MAEQGPVPILELALSFLRDVMMSRKIRIAAVAAAAMLTAGMLCVPALAEDEKTGKTTVTASVNAIFTVTIPEKFSVNLGLGAKSVSIPFLVNVKGDIAEDAVVYVTCGPTKMESKGAVKEIPAVTLSKEAWSREDMLMTGGEGSAGASSIEVELKPGEWRGTMDFDITCSDKNTKTMVHSYLDNNTTK